MKNFKGHTAVGIAVIAVSFLFLLTPDTVFEATGRALSICASRVIPSVFPFSVLSSMFVAVGGTAALDRVLSPVSRRLFGTQRGASALILGMMFGFPLGALTVGAQYRAGTLGKREASRLLAFVCCASPTFPVFAVGVGCFGSAAVGLSIWTAQAASSVMIGIALRGKAAEEVPILKAQDAAPADGESIFTTVTRAVTDAARVILNVCGSVTFFSVMSSVVSDLIGDVTDSQIPQLLVSAVFEFSSGTAAAGAAYDAGTVSRSAAIAIAAFSIGFAGLSVMFQTASVCDGISLFPHLCGKIITGVITASVAYIASRLPSFAATFYSTDAASAHRAVPAALEISGAAVILLLIFFFYKKGCKNAHNGL